MTDPTKCPRCEKQMVGVQYGYGTGKGNECHYDGVSEFICPACGYRIGRWSGKELNEGEHEPPFGESHRKGCTAIKKMGFCKCGDPLTEYDKGNGEKYLACYGCYETEERCQCK